MALKMKASETKEEYFQRCGNTLRNLRKAARPAVTQGHLAKLAGCHRGTVSSIENGHGFSDPHLFATMLQLLQPEPTKAVRA